MIGFDVFAKIVKNIKRNGWEYCNDCCFVTILGVLGYSVESRIKWII